MRANRRVLFIFAILAIFDAAAGESITNVQAGYHDGFYLRSEDERFLLKLGGRLDFGLQLGFLGGSSDYGSFDLVHAKVFAGGNAFSKDVQFYLQAGAARNDRPAASFPIVESPDGGLVLEDYFVKLNRGSANLRVGQFKVPYGRQAMVYSGNLQFTDRSIATRYLTLGRDRGVSGGIGGGRR